MVQSSSRPDPFPAPPPARETELATALATNATLTAAGHEAFLRFAAGMEQAVARNAALQAALVEGGATPSTVVVPPPAEEPGRTLFMDTAACFEFARGSIAQALGPEWAPVDAHPTRVRLPDEPLMLAHRIVTVEGEPRSMSSGRVVTEHDVHPDAWYLDAGRIPTCIAVEAGQSDLFLSGWLGIDFVTQGLAVYRLLDAVVTFHGPLPGPGKRIVYDIRIERFFRQGDTHLFRFNFEATVDGERFLTMTEGCAGFFTEAELAAGQGIVKPRLAAAPRKAPPRPWMPPVPLEGVATLDEAGVDALRRGDLVAAFGDAFAGLPLAAPSRLPGGRMRLVHRVTHLEPAGGEDGLGLVRGEADIHPDDWFLTCHFVDDMVMPGTLMYECCLHTLRVLLARLGWTGEHDTVAWEPVPGVPGRLKCRGQVIETTKTVTYEVTVRELRYDPEPVCIADALMYADGKPVVEMTGMSLRLAGASEDSLRALWEGRGSADAPPPAPAPEGPRRLPARDVPDDLAPRGADGPRPALYDEDRILAFAIGKPSEAFGDRYEPFDGERVIARLPGPPYQLMTRVVDVVGEPWVMAPGTECEAQFDVVPGEWWFEEERSGEMAYAALLEAALQPCGWLAAYMGSALTSAVDISFRNLGGSAVCLRPVVPDSGLLTTRIRTTGVSSSGGMIIQHYDMALHDRVGPVFLGKTYFGFFSKAALADQVGLRDAVLFDAGDAHPRPMPTDAPFPHGHLKMLDTLTHVLPDGGPQGLGFARGTLPVDPSAWYFAAHFHQDPVIPGSLGLESMLQLMKVLAAERWGVNPGDRFASMPAEHVHHWEYRGQVIPPDDLVTVEVAVTAVDDATRTLTATGLLSVDGRHIYRTREFTLRLVR